jgi:MFS family permease
VDKKPCNVPLTRELAQRSSQTEESSPLRRPVFRRFYVGALCTALGYTMQATISAWLMATLTPSELMVALVQSASTIPSLLFGLLAGTLADLIGRRYMILGSQVVLSSATFVLGLAATNGVIEPLSLLLLTFISGTGFAFYQPAQQAAINDLVTRSELARGVALSGIAFHLSRAVGPAMAGAAAASISSGHMMLGVALLFLPMLFFTMRPVIEETAAARTGREKLMPGVVAGLRFTRHSTTVRGLVLRGGGFAVCAASFWALLPVVARDHLHMGPGGFGLLSAAFGVGAVVAAIFLPALLVRVPMIKLIDIGTVLSAGATLTIALATNPSFVFLGAAGAGLAWVAAFSTMTTGIQSNVPNWVRSRAMAVYLVVVQGSLAFGSAIWGVVASEFGTRMALGCAALTMIVIRFLSRHLRVDLAQVADILPRDILADIKIAVEPLPEDGPVAIEVQYEIQVSDRNAFLSAIHALALTRRRNGATAWSVSQDLGHEERFVERYVVASWSDYQRLRSRMTMAEASLQDRVFALQKPDVSLKVLRLLEIKEPA